MCIRDRSVTSSRQSSTTDNRKIAERRRIIMVFLQFRLKPFWRMIIAKKGTQDIIKTTSPSLKSEFTYTPQPPSFVVIAHLLRSQIDPIDRSADKKKMGWDEETLYSSPGWCCCSPKTRARRTPTTLQFLFALDSQLQVIGNLPTVNRAATLNKVEQVILCHVIASVIIRTFHRAICGTSITTFDKRTLVDAIDFVSEAKGERCLPQIPMENPTPTCKRELLKYRCGSLSTSRKKEQIVIWWSVCLSLIKISTTTPKPSLGCSSVLRQKRVPEVSMIENTVLYMTRCLPVVNQSNVIWLKQYRARKCRRQNSKHTVLGLWNLEIKMPRWPVSYTHLTLPTICSV